MFLACPNAQVERLDRLTPHGEYLALSSDESKRLSAYRELFATDLDVGAAGSGLQCA